MFLYINLMAESMIKSVVEMKNWESIPYTDQRIPFKSMGPII